MILMEHEAEVEPLVGSRRRSSSAMVASMAIVIAAALVVACGADKSGTRQTVQPTETTRVTGQDPPARPREDPSKPDQPVPTTATPVSAPPTTPTTPTTVTPERLTSASRVRLDGIGPVRVGMTPEEASAAAGIPIRIDPRTDLGRGCAHARPEGGPERLSFMVVSGRIERVEVGNPDILTLSGVGVGSTEAEVLAAYPNRIRIEPNPYIGHLGGRDLTYMPDETSRHLSLLLTTDGKRVTSFRAGLLGAVLAPEGCA